MDSLSAMEVFVRVVQAGSFSAAARTLDLTPSAVSKQIGRLEDRLGARLMNRTTRQLSLTEVGTGYFERASRILAPSSSPESATAPPSRRHSVCRRSPSSATCRQFIFSP